MPKFSNPEIKRYSRQLMLPQVKAKGQERIRRARVLCIGAGGVGSPVILYLASAGVGTIGVVDFDKVDLSNLQRQVIHGEDKIGVAKTLSAKERASKINSTVKVEAFQCSFNEKNARKLVTKFDVVIDGSDNFETRYLANDACFLEGKPLVHGAVFQFEGRASVFNYKGSACFRCVFPSIPKKDLVPSCAESGVLGPVAGVIGSIMAVEALKII